MGNRASPPPGPPQGLPECVNEPGQLAPGRGSGLPPRRPPSSFLLSCFARGGSVFQLELLALGIWAWLVVLLAHHSGSSSAEGFCPPRLPGW